MSAYLPLPKKLDFNHPDILNKTIKASRNLAQFNGKSKTILISTLLFRKTQDSPAIENIITSQKELFIAVIQNKKNISPQTKEARNDADVIRKGFSLIRKKNLLTVNNIREI